MEYLSNDVLRLIALNLSLKQIFASCQINKRFQTCINNLLFWKALFIREIKEPINIPLDANIKWYKEKIKTYSDVQKIADLIKEGKIWVNFIQLYNEKWNSFEIIENLKELYCEYNQLTSLHSMPNLEVLNCGNNKLTSLPFMPNLIRLYCQNNQLTSLPFISKLVVLNCENNQLTSLPSYQNLQLLYCKANPLPFFNLLEWKRYWKLNI